LDFEARDSYKPLCEFLNLQFSTGFKDGKEVGEIFPWVNKIATYDERMVVMLKRPFETVIKRFCILCGIFSMGSIGAGV
jgi:hypothetical protein